MDDIENRINEIAEYIRKKRLEVPAVLFLEVNKPLALLSGGLVTVAIPFLGAVFPPEKLKSLSLILSDRKHIETLIKTIESKTKEES